MTAAPRVNAAQWRAQQEAAMAQQAARMVQHGEQLATVEAGVRAALDPGRARDIADIARNRTQRLRGEIDQAVSGVQGRVDDLTSQVAQLRDPEQMKALVATVMQGSEMNGVDPVQGLQGAAAKGVFDNVWRFTDDWRPLARPLQTLQNAPLLGAVRAMAQNTGMRPSAAKKLEQVAAAGAGSALAVAGLSALLSPEAAPASVSQTYY